MRKEEIRKGYNMIRCPRCGSEVPSSAKFCPDCGLQRTTRKSNWKERKRPSNTRGCLIPIVAISAVVLVAIVVTIIIIAGAGNGSGVLSGDENYTIKVSGTADLEFSGHYMVVNSDLTEGSKSVDGVVPAQYSVSGTIISCVFQKQVESGTLRVEILKSGQVVAESDTSADYGVVSVATD